MESLQHFSHDHPLSLVYIQSNQNNENSDEEEEGEDANNFIEEDQHVGKCNMCKEDIYLFHLSYYRCKDCDYSLHKFCAELPTILQNHPLHPGHNLTLSEKCQFYDSDNPYNNYLDDEWTCWVCKLDYKKFFNYYCSVCKFSIDIICATMSTQKMNHSGHPHQLERMFRHILSLCDGCGKKHAGIFFHCTICRGFQIHVDCALLPVKLLIQKHTNKSFSHSHSLTLAYSFPYVDRKDKFNPRCRVCSNKFRDFLWLYKCEKCRYYVHFDCAASKNESFMSIFLREGPGKTFKNFKDDDYPKLLQCPFDDQCNNLLEHHFIKHKDSFVEQHDDDTFTHSSHHHRLIFINTQASLCNKLVFLHNPMKKIQLLCNGCVKPITKFRFYKCSQDATQCGFVLHEWCARLPTQIQDHPGHPKHTLVLLPNIPDMFFGVFKCNVCTLDSNAFAYGCTDCSYYVDINCAFIPEQITHEAHPNHILRRVKAPYTLSRTFCKACRYTMKGQIVFNCPSCDFYLHTECAFLLPKTVSHKYNKHPLSLRYLPVENHISEYFCEICEEKIDPQQWFYHCTISAQSIHAACAPLILHSEQGTFSSYNRCVFKFINVKFGGTIEITNCHPHELTFIQGIESDGVCGSCDRPLQYDMIFKCLTCTFALHFRCAMLLNKRHHKKMVVNRRSLVS